MNSREEKKGGREGIFFISYGDLYSVHQSNTKFHGTEETLRQLSDLRWLSLQNSAS